MKRITLLKVLMLVAVALALGLWLNGQPKGVEAQEPSGEGIDAQVVVNTVFTYQGFLKNGSNPAQGSYDFELKLFDTATNGTGVQVGPTVLKGDQTVTDGYFSVELDFGDVFKGQARWLQIGVRDGASTGPYTILSPRTRLTFTPYALSLRPGATITNTGSPGLQIQTSSTAASAAGLIGQVTSTAPGSLSVGVRGINNGTGANGIGVYGSHNGNGWGVYGTAVSGIGVVGSSTNGLGVQGKSTANHGVWGESAGNNFSGVIGISTHNNGFGGGFLNSSGGVALYAEGNGSTRTKPALEVHNTQANNGMATYMTNGSDFATAHFANSGNGEVLYLQANGGLFIKAVDNAESDTKFSVDYTGKTTTKSLQITGGSDLSEQFDIQDSLTGLKPSPGLVVSIDPEHPGELIVSGRAYDRMVAGIVSGAGGVNPGMVMGQSGSTADGQYPVALTGRVYVWADASNGPIQPGDLLTTSATPGHVMKVTDYDKAQRAILGKAMSRLEEGKGLVLVLVSLQ